MPEGFRPNLEHYADEMPQTEVYVDDFYIDKFEVTNAQYNEFVSQTGYPPPTITMIWLNLITGQAALSQPALLITRSFWLVGKMPMPMHAG